MEESLIRSKVSYVLGYILLLAFISFPGWKQDNNPYQGDEEQELKNERTEEERKITNTEISSNRFRTWVRTKTKTTTPAPGLRWPATHSWLLKSSGVVSHSPLDHPATPHAGPRNRLQQHSLAKLEGTKWEYNLVYSNIIMLKLDVLDQEVQISGLHLASRPSQGEIMRRGARD